jgi:phosphonate transport system substrate-binding protein
MPDQVLTEGDAFALSAFLSGLRERPEVPRPTGEPLLAVLRFGVTPFFGAERTSLLYGELAAYLSRQIGVRTELVVSKDVADFNRRLARGDFDLLYVSPLQYVRAHTMGGYEAIARARAPRSGGVLVVRADSAAKGPDALPGRTLALAHPAAYEGAVLTRAKLEDSHGLDVYKRTTVQFAGTDEAVLRAVLDGTAEFGAVSRAVLDQLDPAERDRLKVVLETGAGPQAPFAVRPDLPFRLVERLKAALIGLGEKPAGRRAVQRLRWERVDAAANEHYDDVRALAQRFAESGKPYRDEFYWR